MSWLRMRISLLIVGTLILLWVFHAIGMLALLKDNDTETSAPVRSLANAPSLVSKMNVPLESQLGWKATSCSPGAWLRHKKLLRYCRDPAAVSMPVYPAYCEAILRPGPPPCGFFIGGMFREPLRVLPVAALSRLLRGGDAACASRATYDGSQGNSTLLAVDTGDVLVPAFEVRPSACASYRYFSPREALSILHHASISRNGRGIVVSGDSMMRHLLLRLVFFLRGEEVFSEHYFHSDAVYVVYEERDEILIPPRCTHRALLETYFPGYNVTSPDGAPCGLSAPLTERVVAAFLFVWDVTPRRFREDVFLIENPPVHLAAFMYWWKRGVDHADDIRQYFTRLRRRVSATKMHRAVTTDYVFYTTPWTDSLAGHVLPEDARVVRNTHARSSIREMQRELGEDGKMGPRFSLVDFAAIADVRHVNRTMDLLHFMCNWIPEFPREVQKQKYNGVGCRDPTNLAVVQWTLHLLMEL
ncbi:hypothetical protein DQ04_03111000 [Trypanosoma grayi]|uniref:hypothetical protein n=1 Tax=Trypanosoma grayi TaxID=71804 RepID=UPI0004F45513|nr:hypothetical protein DQ04_03111000 [Trypanosoma grayi]KEG10955.1 hypothetical protein DQ04_03111000 [Trypanosoma grayi]